MPTNFFILVSLFTSCVYADVYQEVSPASKTTVVRQRNCDPAKALRKCERTKLKCEKEFSARGLKNEYPRNCGSEKPCDPGLELLGNMSLGCGKGVVYGVKDIVVGIATLIATPVTAGIRGYSSEISEEAKQRHLAFIKKIEPYKERIRVVCGESPYGIEKFKELAKLGTSTKKSDLIKWRRRRAIYHKKLRTYPSCQYRILKEGGILKSESKLKKQIAKILLDFNAKAKCYNPKGITYLACNALTYVISIDKGASRVGKLTGISKPIRKIQQRKKSAKATQPPKSVQVCDYQFLRCYRNSKSVIAAMKTSGVDIRNTQILYLNHFEGYSMHVVVRHGDYIYDAAEKGRHGVASTTVSPIPIREYLTSKHSTRDSQVRVIPAETYLKQYNGENVSDFAGGMHGWGSDPVRFKTVPFKEYVNGL